MPETRPSPREVVYAHRRKEAIADQLETLPPERAEAFATGRVLDCSLEVRATDRNVRRVRFAHLPLETPVARAPIRLQPREAQR